MSIKPQIPGVHHVARRLSDVARELDETLGRRYVAFKHPDRIAWEFYTA